MNTIHSLDGTPLPARKGKKSQGSDPFDENEVTRRHGGVALEPGQDRVDLSPAAMEILRKLREKAQSKG